MFNEAAWVSVSVYATGLATVKYGSEETNPNVSLMGVDENNLIVSGYEIESGRNFSPDEIRLTRHYVIIGSDISKDLFIQGLILWVKRYLLPDSNFR